MVPRRLIGVPLLFSFLSALLAPVAAGAGLHFRKVVLSDKFYAEGAAFGDLNNDGNIDAIAGPFWYAGPDFVESHAIYEAVAVDPLKYSDNFAAAAQDVNGDGWKDVLVVGFPGKDAWWFENPGRTPAVSWKRHLIFSGVDNESAGFADVDGDRRLDLLCMHAKQIGFATADREAHDAAWQFRAITPAGDRGAFTHGLGAGDLDADGRVDVLEVSGWWRQPVGNAAGQSSWIDHGFRFGEGRGGAQMLVYDVNGDKRADVITSIDAHGYGLSWFEQLEPGPGAAPFRGHVILSPSQAERHGGTQFSQLHALVLADVDGDGLQDIITGKRWWAHGPAGDPEPNAPAVIYAFLLRRDANGRARFEPHLIDDASGVGTQFEARDVNDDGRADIVTSNKKGTFVFLSVSGDSGR